MWKKTAGISLIVAAAVLIGCVGMNARARPDATEFPRTVSHAFPQDRTTAAGRALYSKVHAERGESGFRLFEYGNESLSARIALVRLAEKSVDMQYYAMGNDLSSKLMLEALLRAASRGVRVRVLIDNFTIKDTEDALLALNHNKNIEIRVFNPATTVSQSPVSKLVSMFGDLSHTNRRMHNKSLIVDNQLAIMGGRNLSDEYFENDKELSFRDIDVLTAGPITNSLSVSFDQYWNDKNAFPVDQVYTPEHGGDYVTRLRNDLHATWERELKNPERKEELTASLPEILKGSNMKMVWAKGELAADDPEKITKPKDYRESKPLDRLLELVDQSKQSFLIISAYFVPKDEGVAWLGRIRERGVRVAVLTNSLASTDVVAVHSGYAPYRAKLIKEGVEVYELIPINQKKSRQRLLGRSQPPHAGLHSKAYVIDGQHVVIGSYNLDPRSTEINTEMAVIIHSREVAEQMGRIFAQLTNPDISYSISLDEQGGTVWKGVEKGKPVLYHHEPHAGFWRGMQNTLFNMLPFEDQL